MSTKKKRKLQTKKKPEKKQKIEDKKKETEKEILQGSWVDCEGRSLALVRQLMSYLNTETRKQNIYETLPISIVHIIVQYLRSFDKAIVVSGDYCSLTSLFYHDSNQQLRHCYLPSVVCARRSHCVAQINKELWMFGGRTDTCNSQNTRACTSIERLDMKLNPPAWVVDNNPNVFPKLRQYLHSNTDEYLYHICFSYNQKFQCFSLHGPKISKIFNLPRISWLIYDFDGDALTPFETENKEMDGLLFASRGQSMVHVNHEIWCLFEAYTGFAMCSYDLRDNQWKQIFFPSCFKTWGRSMFQAYYAHIVHDQETNCFFGVGTFRGVSKFTHNSLIAGQSNNDNSTERQECNVDSRRLGALFVLDHEVLILLENRKLQRFVKHNLTEQPGIFILPSLRSNPSCHLLSTPLVF